MTYTDTLINFLTSIGASLDQHRHSHIDNSPLEPTDNFISPLSHYGLLTVHGPDSSKFLQGQSSCNLQEVNDHCSRPGVFCNPKGRMISSFHLARNSNEHYSLKMRRPLVTSSKAALAKYLVFSKAEQRDDSDNYLLLGLSGDRARQAIHNSFGSAPAGRHGTVVQDNNIAIQMDEAGNCYECWIEASEITKVWPSLSEGLTIQGSHSWELLMIRQGLADVEEATVEAFIPQMLNYQLTGAISFTKGCYTGQEVVARMQYKGTLKRRLYRVRVTAKKLMPGTDLYNSETEQKIGSVVNAVSLDNDHSEALAVITIKDVENNTDISTANSAKLEVLSLPYAITN